MATLIRPPGDSAPPSAGPAERSKSAARDEQPRLAGIAVLVVEDDAASRKLVEVVLAEAGANVVSAATAEEALEMLACAPAKALVVDLLLPEMDGFSLIQHLRKDAPTRGVLAIAVSSMSGREAERAAIAAGYDAYIRKPLDSERLVATIAARVRPS